jgi:hypothetical protein
MFSILTPEPIHKLEIYDTGEKTLAEMQKLAASIFDIDPHGLGLMRVDLCADIHGVDVGFFKRHTIIRSKQTNRELGGILPYMTIQKGRVETIYAGAKPNQYRIYNKSAERMVRWKWYARKLARQAPHLTPSPYEVLYGHSPDERIIRVERQIAGRDLARIELTDFASLRHTPTLSPFQKIVFYEARNEEPSKADFGFQRWTSGMYVRDMVRDQGLSAARACVRDMCGRNFYREWKKIEPFLHVPEHSTQLSSVDLLGTFRKSALRQIEGKREL